MTRGEAHRGSAHSLGNSHPRQEGPADLRLVCPALALWGAAALAVALPGRTTALGVVLCVCLAILLLAWTVLQRGGSSSPARTTTPASGDGAARRDSRLRLNATALAAVLLAAAAGAVAGGLHSADQRRGPLPDMAAAHSRATVELTISTDPRFARPRAPSESWMARALLFDAEVTRVTAPGGEVTATRNPVLVIVRPGLPQAALARWQRLLPSTRLRLHGQLAPPLADDHRFAAVLKVPGGRPEIIQGPSSLQRRAGDLRAGLREASKDLSPDARALLPGFVVGDTTRVTPDLQRAFEATDLTHLLAVSGSNLSIVLILLIGPPGRALLAERGGLAPRLGITLRGTALLGGTLTLAFVIVCRPEPSVLRAAACGAIVLLAIATGRRRSLIPALAAAVVVLVLYDPGLSRSYGFLLSVLATGSLLTIAPRWSASLQRRGVPPRPAEALAAAAAAQAVCAPVVAIFAARVSLVAVPCNLFAELAIAPATVLGFLALATAPVFMPLAESLAQIAGWPTGWIASVARAGASLPGAQLDWQDGWRGGLSLAAITVLVVLALRRLPRHPWVALVCALVLLCAVVRPAPLTRVLTGWPPPGWTFAMCDVGQGDAMVLSAGDGRAVVVDAGPDPVAVDACLRTLSVERISLVLLTHFHADHVRGLPGVLKGRSVGAVQTTTLQEPPEQSAFVQRVSARAQVPLTHVRMGEWRKDGRLSWQVLWPRPHAHRGELPHVEAPGRHGGLEMASGFGLPEGPNDASVTLWVEIAEGPTLLMLGDLEPPAQRGLLIEHPRLARVDVLKVAHHGSAHQHPELFTAARPRLALISVGRGNTYGHPSPRTVNALRDVGARVLRTDRDGPIAVTGDGQSLRAHIGGSAGSEGTLASFRHLHGADGSSTARQGGAAQGGQHRLPGDASRRARPRCPSRCHRGRADGGSIAGAVIRVSQDRVPLRVRRLLGAVISRTRAAAVASSCGRATPRLCLRRRRSRAFHGSGFPSATQDAGFVLLAGRAAAVLPTDSVPPDIRPAMHHRASDRDRRAH